MGRKRFIAATRKLPPLNDIAVTIPLMDEKRWQRFWKGQYTYSGQRGYFGVYMGSASWNKTRNHVLLEVPFAELERPFVIDALFTRGDADAFLLHSPAKQVSQNWFAFRLSESRPTRTLDVYRPQLDVRIQTNVSELARSYAAGTWTGWEKSLPLVAIVQPNTTMTRSWRRVPKSLNDTLGWRLIVGISPWVSDGFSVLFPDLSKKAAEAKTQAAVPKWTWRTVDAKAFPRNVQVRLQAMITRTEQASDWNPQQRFAAEISFQLIRLPEDPLSLRLADERIGYFTTSFLLLDHDQGLHERIDVINRRRLPVVYHIDPTVPRRWRPYLKKGVENWQTAFEQAGWEASGAGQEPPIRAVLPEDDDWPLDYDIADVRFNTISWSPSLGSVFALGPSSTDPRTGEILNSHIIFTHGWIRSIMRQYTNLVAAQQRMSCRNGTDRLARRRSREWTLTPLELPSSPPSISRIHHVDEARLDIPAFAILESLALVSDLGDVPERFIGESLTDTTMHEVGHTLGLRHNFRASANVRWQALSDSAYVERHGITSSVMDYVPILIFADSRKQTRYFQHVLGAYDMMAIRYGYGPRQTLPETSPERSTLNLRVAIDEALAEHRTELATLAQQAVEKGLHFGTDEDDPSPAGVDVYVSQWDLSDDPLQYHENVVQLLERIVPRLRTLVHQRDLSWADYTELVRYAIIFASRSALYTTKFFGSIELRRSHPADLTATRTTVQVPRKPVDAETMQQALALLRRLLSPLEPGAFLGGNGGNDEHGYSQWTQELVEESGQCKGLETYCLGLRPVPVLDLLRRTRHQVLSLALDPKRLTRLRENAQLQRIATLPLNTYLAAWTEMFFGNGSTEVLRTMSPFALDAQADYVLMLRETLQNMTKTNEDPVAILAITYELRRLHCLVHSVLHKLGHAAEKETTDETYRVHLVGLSSLLSNRFPPLNESGVFNAATVPCPQFG
jgi:predicted Zn-dependent protease with MMP-like domain